MTSFDLDPLARPLVARIGKDLRFLPTSCACACVTSDASRGDHPAVGKTTGRIRADVHLAVTRPHKGLGKR